MSAPRRLGAVVAALVATVALLEAGSGALATPPLGSWDDLDAWYLHSGPAVAVIALLRLVALAAGGYLVLVGGLQLVAPRLAIDRLTALVDRLSPGFLRVLSRGTAGLSFTAGLALPMLPAVPTGDPPGTAVMVPLDLAAEPTSTTTTGPPPTTTTTTATTTTAPTVRPEAAPPDPGPVLSPAAPPHEVVVAPGDSFWSIAVDEAGDRDLPEYWRALIDANRDRLVDASNPDLLYPDQVLRLP